MGPPQGERKYFLRATRAPFVLRSRRLCGGVSKDVSRAEERCAGFHVWNLGGSRTITLAALVRKIAAGLGVPLKVRQVPMQPGDVDRTWADVARVERELGWRAAVEIDRGLSLFLEWFRAQEAGRP